MPTLQVRDLPEHLYRKIVELAKSERRSIAQETIILLEKALEITTQNKTRRKQLLDHIIMETENNTYTTDAASLVREDRDR